MGSHAQENSAEAEDQYQPPLERPHYRSLHDFLFDDSVRAGKDDDTIEHARIRRSELGRPNETVRNLF